MLLLHPYSLVDTWIDTAVTPWPSHGTDTVPPPYVVFLLTIGCLTLPTALGQCDAPSVECGQLWLLWYSTFKFQSSAGPIRHLIQWQRFNTYLSSYIIQLQISEIIYNAVARLEVWGK